VNRACEALAHLIVGAVWLADRIADPVVCRWANESHLPMEGGDDA